MIIIIIYIYANNRSKSRGADAFCLYLTLYLLHIYILLSSHKTIYYNYWGVVAQWLTCTVYTRTLVVVTTFSETFNISTFLFAIGLIFCFSYPVQWRYTIYIYNFMFRSRILFRVFWSIKIKLWTVGFVKSLDERSLNSGPTFGGVPVSRLWQIN